MKGAKTYFRLASLKAVNKLPRMRFSTPFLAAFGTLTLLSGCAHHRRLPTWETPLSKTEFQSVRTTAYTHTEADHIQYSNHNALGTILLTGPLKSASADWGRWPAGTIFRVVPTNETYVVDDYGWAIAGTNTIDLYKPTRTDMNHWGVRRVDIQVLQWGDPRASYSTLLPRGKHAHVKRMLTELQSEM